MPSTQAWLSTVLHKALLVYLSKPAGRSEEIPKPDALYQHTFPWSDSNLCEFCHEVLEVSQGGPPTKSLRWFPRPAPPELIHSLPPRQPQPKWRHARPTTRTMLVRLLKAFQSMAADTQTALAAVKRILQEARELANDSCTDYHAAPLEVFSSSCARFGAVIAHCLLSRIIYLCVSTVASCGDNMWLKHPIIGLALYHTRTEGHRV